MTYLFLTCAGDTEAEIFSSVKRGVFEFRSPEWDPISDLAKGLMISMKIVSSVIELNLFCLFLLSDFIRNLLQKDPAKRLTPQSALDHPWYESLPIHCIVRLIA